MNLSKKVGFEALVLGACLFLGTALPATGIRTQDAQQPAADNTKNNKGDQSPGAMTADKQKMNPADRDLTKKIRTALHSDASLSTYAHNIKIISQDGKVTLKGARAIRMTRSPAVEGEGYRRSRRPRQWRPESTDGCATANLNFPSRSATIAKLLV